MREISHPFFHVWLQARNVFKYNNIIKNTTWFAISFSFHIPFCLLPFILSLYRCFLVQCSHVHRFFFLPFARFLIRCTFYFPSHFVMLYFHALFLVACPGGNFSLVFSCAPWSTSIHFLGLFPYLCPKSQHVLPFYGSPCVISAQSSLVAELPFLLLLKVCRKAPSTSRKGWASTWACVISSLQIW